MHLTIRISRQEKTQQRIIKQIKIKFQKNGIHKIFFIKEIKNLFNNFWNLIFFTYDLWAPETAAHTVGEHKNLVVIYKKFSIIL